MHGAQMRERCPGSRFVATAALENHLLCFPRHSPNRGCGVASIVPHVGERVWGVVYEMTAEDFLRLDGFEGYFGGCENTANAYHRQEVSVLRAGRAGDLLTAFAYFGVASAGGPFVPSAHYLGLMISGAEEWRLPADYVAALKAIAVA
jgi:gamma-glutamylcyclotransferase (GGCT)/AIG2-like uncharacterized protein YtfP